MDVLPASWAGPADTADMQEIQTGNLLIDRVQDGSSRLIECRPKEKADDDIGQGMVGTERVKRF